ncbi:MAG: hypothetical protein ABFD12_12105 [Syntrophorhabdus sp.]
MDIQKIQNQEEDRAIEKEIIRLTTDRLPHYGWLFTDCAMSDLSGKSHGDN